MKQAYFTYKSEPSGRDRVTTVYGTVTLKDDKKVSISIFHANEYSYRDKFHAKRLAQEIVDVNFKHPAVTKFHEENTKGLIKRLTEETQELKRRYIQRTKQYAVKKWRWAKERSKWQEEDYIKAYGEQDMRYPMRYWQGGEYVTKAKELSNYGKEQRSEVLHIMYNGVVTEFAKKEIKYAERHYADSIAKLASRIYKRGVKDGDTMTIETAVIGQNINTTINHPEVGTIVAYTIIASGPVQRPHYRYLIK